ncbi:hypothetical protein NFI96_024347, partial [Prochilodus magdalenae]
PLIHVGGVSTCWNSRTQISPHYLNTGTTMMFLCSLSLFIIMIDGSSAQSISPLENRTQVHTVDDQTVTLSCKYDGNVQNLQWYHQYPGSRPEYLLTIYPGSDAVSRGRLKAEVDKDLKRVDLKISSAAVSDSVLYYCALQPTVTGNPDTLYRNSLLALPVCVITYIHIYVVYTVYSGLDGGLCVGGDASEFVHTVYNYGLFNTDKAILIIFTESCVSQSISPLEEKVDAVEGQTVTLSCSYEKATSLFWYRQYPGSRPEYLLSIVPSTKGVSYTTPRIPRLDGAVNGGVVDLMISSAAVSDSVLYYCALVPTVTGSPDTLYRN